MNEDITYCPGQSIVDLPITSPAHLACPDMVGMENIDPDKIEKSLQSLEELRAKHGLRRRVKPEAKPMDYICTETTCLPPCDIRNLPKSRPKIVSASDKKWRSRLQEKSLRLPDRTVTRAESNEAK